MTRSQLLSTAILCVTGHVAAWPEGKTESAPNEPPKPRTYSSIEQALRTPSKVHVLDLSAKGLKQVPPQVTAFSNLEVLFLYKNDLCELPSQIAQLGDLRELNLHQNKISSLPRSFSRLKGLRRLLLGSNRLRTVPEEIFALGDLVELDLRHNQIADIPERIGNLESLRVLHLGHNELDHIPDSVFALSNLERLILWNNRIQSVPADIAKLAKLKVLHLADSPIRTLPSEIGELRDLTGLSLALTGIQDIPAQFGRLSNLTWLDLEGARFKELPYCIANLKQLETLGLGKTSLSDVDHTFGILVQLPKLRRVDMNMCGLKRIPASVGKCRNLEKLAIGIGNRFTKLPAEITRLPKLKETDLKWRWMSKPIPPLRLSHRLVSTSNRIELRIDKGERALEGLKLFLNVDGKGLEANVLEMYPVSGGKHFLEVRAEPSATPLYYHTLFRGPVVVEGNLAERVLALIEGLGDDQYGTRAKSQNDLVSIGQFAAPFLRKRIDDPDPEIAHRVREALKAIAARQR